MTQSHETIHNIHAQVLDSFIAVILVRPLIRENHLVQKIPLYFDEVTRFKPNQSQSVLPVAALSSTSARCRGTQSCVTCVPFVAQGYDGTLCSLSVLRTDHPHVQTERRRRPHVDAFAEHPLTDGSHLIPRSVEDDDDIDWPEDPFDRPDSASPKSQDELLAMIHFEGSPALQDALRALCREFIDIFDTAVRPLPAKVDAMVIEIGRSKWELPQNRLPQRIHSPKLMHCFHSGSSRSPGQPIGVWSIQFASPMAHSGSPWILLSSTPQQADWKVGPSLTFSKPCLD